ncbi:hypothetical protein ACTXT7_004595 [Hymenolepis weldensis]
MLSFSLGVSLQRIDLATRKQKKNVCVVLVVLAAAFRQPIDMRKQGMRKGKWTWRRKRGEEESGWGRRVGHVQTFTSSVENRFLPDRLQSLSSQISQFMKVIKIKKYCSRLELYI